MELIVDKIIVGAKDPVVNKDLNLIINGEYTDLSELSIFQLDTVLKQLTVVRRAAMAKYKMSAWHKLCKVIFLVEDEIKVRAEKLNVTVVCNTVPKY